MPLDADDQAQVDKAVQEAAENGDSKLLVRNASESQKLGPPTVICMIMNRTFGMQFLELFHIPQKIN